MCNEKKNITDWQVEQMDVLPDQEITVNKSGTDCYVINTNICISK